MKNKITKNAVAVIGADERTFIERSDAGKRDAVALLMNKGIEKAESATARISNVATEFIRAFNEAREAGQFFTEAEKIGQFEFRAFHTDVESWRVEAIRREKVKAYQKIFRAMPEPAQTIEDCQLPMQAMFELTGLVEKSRRLGGETAHEPLNPFNAFISSAATVETWLKKFEPEDSSLQAYYESCKAETLQKIAMAIKPMADRYAIVMQLLQEKGES